MCNGAVSTTCVCAWNTLNWKLWAIITGVIEKPNIYTHSPTQTRSDKKKSVKTKVDVQNEKVIEEAHRALLHTESPTTLQQWNAKMSDILHELCKNMIKALWLWMKGMVYLPNNANYYFNIVNVYSFPTTPRIKIYDRLEVCEYSSFKLKSNINQISNLISLSHDWYLN